MKLRQEVNMKEVY